MIPFAVSGMYCGSILGFPVCGILVEADIPVFGGWQSCFYLFGLIGIVWFPFWTFFAYEHPEHHPSISKEEVDHINRGIFS
jgi:ACS family sodium-dependent inorganic phosphate cotransporter-like MFS transporter 6/7/8